MDDEVRFKIDPKTNRVVSSINSNMKPNLKFYKTKGKTFEAEEINEALRNLDYETGSKHKPICDGVYFTGEECNKKLSHVGPYVEEAEQAEEDGYYIPSSFYTRFPKIHITTPVTLFTKVDNISRAEIIDNFISKVYNKYTEEPGCQKFNMITKTEIESINMTKLRELQNFNNLNINFHFSIIEAVARTLDDYLKQENSIEIKNLQKCIEEAKIQDELNNIEKAYLDTNLNKKIRYRKYDHDYIKIIQAYIRVFSRYLSICKLRFTICDEITNSLYHFPNISDSYDTVFIDLKKETVNDDEYVVFRPLFLPFELSLFNIINTFDKDLLDYHEILERSSFRNLFVVLIKYYETLEEKDRSKFLENPDKQLKELFKKERNYNNSNNDREIEIAKYIIKNDNLPLSTFYLEEYDFLEQ